MAAFGVAHSVRRQLLKWAPAIRMTILLVIFITAVLVRVFSVIRYEVNCLDIYIFFFLLWY
jgi:hypothetical protein